MTDYGTDISTMVADGEGGTGLDPFFVEIDGKRAVVECAIRGCLQREGELDDAPDDGGGGVHDLLSKAATQRDVNAWRDRLFNTIMQDSRVAGVPVLDARILGSPTRIKLAGKVELVSGEIFPLVADISALDINLILPA